jgi:hypothetical protein
VTSHFGFLHGGHVDPDDVWLSKSRSVIPSRSTRIIEQLLRVSKRSFLHRRRNPVATDNDDRCLPCAVALLLPTGDEHMLASLQIGLTASDKVDDFGVARDDNGLLAILVFDLQRVPLDFLHLLRDGSIGHGTIRH